MTKTERWYAIVEELRAVSPRPRSAQWLADRFEVTRRTIERDLDGLLQAGVPLYAHPRRRGGHVLDRTATFSPPALDADEVTALAVAVARLEGTPFADAGRAALTRLLSTLDSLHRDDVAARVARVALLDPPAESVPAAVQRALREQRVLHLTYLDASGHGTDRDVEPLGLLGGDRWYLVGWCRLRDGVRGFRLDRIEEVRVLPERAPRRDVDLTSTAPGHLLRSLPDADLTG